MKPRMLVTFDKDFNALPVSVRVGQVRTGSFILLSSLLRPELYSNLNCDSIVI